jgi:hypothetical protein
MTDILLLLSASNNCGLWSRRDYVATPEARQKISQALRGKKHNYKNGNCRAVVTPLGEFDSILLAGQAHGIQGQIVQKIIKKGARGWYYKDTPGTDVNAPHIQNRQAVKTPLGVFKSRGAAAREHGCDVSVIDRKCRQGVPGYEYI